MILTWADKNRGVSSKCEKRKLIVMRMALAVHVMLVMMMMIRIKMRMVWSEFL